MRKRQICQAGAILCSSVIFALVCCSTFGGLQAAEVPSTSSAAPGSAPTTPPDRTSPADEPGLRSDSLLTELERISRLGSGLPRKEAISMLRGLTSAPSTSTILASLAMRTDLDPMVRALALDLVFDFERLATIGFAAAQNEALAVCADIVSASGLEAGFRAGALQRTRRLLRDLSTAAPIGILPRPGGDDRATAVLATAVADATNSAEVRGLALRLLADLGAPAAFDWAQRVLERHNDEPSPLVESAIRTTSSDDHSGISRVAVVLDETTDWGVFVTAAVRLGEIGSEESLVHLVRNMNRLAPPAAPAALSLFRERLGAFLASANEHVCCAALIASCALHLEELAPQVARIRDQYPAPHWLHDVADRATRFLSGPEKWNVALPPEICSGEVQP